MKKIIFAIGVLFLAWACEDDSGPDVNPFDDQQVNQDTVRLEITDPEPASIAGIYQNVFKPTCANVGCHDGTFEPDFRTLESSYNTLIFQEPIKNDGNYSYRVTPGQPQNSVLMARLNDLIGPPMPIQIEPDSDWPEKGSTYIQNIRDWITAGAPDVSGNVREINYPTPGLLGAGAEAQGVWLQRDNITGPIEVSKSETELTFYFAFDHAMIASTELTHNQIAFSGEMDGFGGGTVNMSLEVMPSSKFERGFYGEVVEYTHRVVVTPGVELDHNADQWFFRTYVQDDQNPVTEIPNDNGIYTIKNYMSLEWVD